MKTLRRWCQVALSLLKWMFYHEYMAGLILLFALLLLSHLDPFPVKYVREKCFDTYQVLRPRPTPLPEDRLVAIVDIDEKSLEELGQWPWSRKTTATLVANLHNMGASVVAFDVVFPEADRLNPAALLDTLENLNTDIRDTVLALESNDEIFASILGQTSVVLGRAGFWDRRPNDSKVLEKRAIAVRNLGADAAQATDFLSDIPTLISNLPLLEKNAAGVGVFAFKPMLDGIVRQVPLVIQHKGNLFPSLAVEAVRVGLQIPTLMLEVDPHGIHAVAIAPRTLVKPDGLKIVTDEHGQVRPYFSLHDPSLYVSASDILQQRLDPSRIAGKIVFVGSSAAGLLDIRSTPVSSQIPGVEIHAQVVENMLKLDREKEALVPAGLFLSRSHFASKGGEIVLIALGGLLMIILTPRWGAKRSLAVFAILTSSCVAASWHLFSARQILLDPSFAVITAFLLYATLTYLSLTREEKAKRLIRNAFGKYLSPAMVELVAEHPEQLKLGGQKREMTLLFCDVRGFTTLSEQFGAEGLIRLINTLFSPLTDVILANGGTVDKYIGDCIMAFWNAPLDDAQHARHGCLSALQMLEKVTELNRDLILESETNKSSSLELKVGLGLNSGECVVGNMGSAQRFDYSVLGDTVNLASRLEGQSKMYGVPIVIGEKTQALAPMLATLELDTIKVKGKTKAVRIFTLIGDEKVEQSSEFKALKKSVDSMLSKWRTRDWNAALVACQEARELGKPYGIEGFFDLYDQRIATFRASPPAEDWDGVFVATTK